MQCIEELINDVYNSSKIPFQLIIDGVGIYSSPMFKIPEMYIRKRAEYRGIKYTIIVNEKYELAIELLKTYLEKNLTEVIIKKEDLLYNLLEEKDVEDEVINIVWPELREEFELINISIDTYSIDVYEEIKEIYSNSKVEVVYYENNILLIGNIKNTLEKIKSIKNTINNDYCRKCYITYCNVENHLYIKQAYNDTVYRLELAVKYEVNNIIFNDKELILEELVDSIAEDVKVKIRDDFNSKIMKLDNEMLKTIEVFFKCGLNLSESAKELYIHRNTLIYRLDKIQKITSYDIREFNNAMLFKIIFLYIGRKSYLTVEKK